MEQSRENGLYLTIGVTGHRDLVEAECPDIAQRIEQFYRDLQHRFPDLPLQLVTPLAEGGDQLAAEQALSRGLRVVALLPMELGEYEKDFQTPGSLNKFRELLGRVDQVIVLPDVADSLPGYSDRSDRRLQYAQAGVFISDHAHVLLALWDGKPALDIGGTGQVVRYHLSGLMEGLAGDPTPAGLLADNENDLVHHVVCSRARPEGEPADGLQPGQVAWLTSRGEERRSGEFPLDYQNLLARLQRFAADWHDKRHLVRVRSDSLLEETPGVDIPGGAALTDRLFRAADGLAVHYQSRVFSSLRAVHVLAILMGLVFLLYTEFNGPAYMVVAFLALFFAGVAVHLIGVAREWHRKYLDYRTLAEGLRVQLYWNLSGVVEKEWAGFAYDNFLLKQDTDLGWVRHVMRQASMYRVRGVSPHEDWLPWVIGHWIGNAGDGRGQLDYYTRKAVINTARFRRTQRLGNLCLWSGIAIAAILFFTHSIASDLQRDTLLVLMGALPLVAGVWDAYSHKKAEKELIRQYRFMGDVFSKARRLMDENDDPAFQRSVLKALGQAALEEGAEWLLIHRERPVEHGRL